MNQYVKVYACMCLYVLVLHSGICMYVLVLYVCAGMSLYPGSGDSRPIACICRYYMYVHVCHYKQALCVSVGIAGMCYLKALNVCKGIVAICRYCLSVQCKYLSILTSNTY